MEQTNEQRIILATPVAAIARRCALRVCISHIPTDSLAFNVPLAASRPQALSAEDEAEYLEEATRCRQKANNYHRGKGGGGGKGKGGKGGGKGGKGGGKGGGGKGGGRGGGRGGAW